MPIDTRRELGHIWREYQRYYRQVGEQVVWFKFDVDGSKYDDIYDTGGRSYLPGIRMPILWVDQIEDPEQYSEMGRRPTQRIRFAVSSRMMVDRGISTYEAHGHQLDSRKPGPPHPPQPGRAETPWLDDRLNDVIFYDNRFYSVSNFQIRGRVRNKDSIIGVAGLELIPEDESLFDFFPYGDKLMDFQRDETESSYLDIYVRYDDAATVVTLEFGVPLEGTWSAYAVNEEGRTSIPTTVTGTDIELDLSGFTENFPYEWALEQTTPTGQTIVVYQGNIYEVVAVDDTYEDTEWLDVFIDPDAGVSTLTLDFRDPDTNELLELSGEWDAYIEMYSGIWNVPIDESDQENGIIVLDFSELEAKLPADWWLVQTTPSGQSLKVYEGAVYLVDQEV